LHWHISHGVFAAVRLAANARFPGRAEKVHVTASDIIIADHFIEIDASSKLIFDIETIIAFASAAITVGCGRITGDFGYKCINRMEQG
jgi:hypothetical protein